MLKKAILLLTCVLISITGAGAATYKTLYSFNQDASYWPFANLVIDQNGNLYGVAAYGMETSGTIFQLTPSPAGWSYSILHQFQLRDPNGEEPLGGLVIDEAGTLYGTASFTSDGGSGCGSIFKLSPSDGFAVVHFFSGIDGCSPQANLNYRQGSLWGTTVAGGSEGQGTVFSIATSGGAIDSYSFEKTRGASPLGGVNRWNYGTTNSGGRSGRGNIYRLDPVKRLVSTYSFTVDGPAGYSPRGDLLAMYIGKVRMMYGTASSGGSGGGGTVYQLREREEGSEQWQMRMLHSFSGADGGNPLAGLVADAVGNLYGTTSQGGDWNCGTVFKLSPGKNTTWNYKVVYSFHSDHNLGQFDGCHPSSGLVLDSAGNLYGTTLSGGDWDLGAVYQIAP
jgi:uncharacterized repeat protein (TIGR03803 family)